LKRLYKLAVVLGLAVGFGCSSDPNKDLKPVDKSTAAPKVVKEPDGKTGERAAPVIK
jgi:hypothetical protein